MIHQRDQRSTLRGYRLEEISQTDQIVAGHRQDEVKVDFVGPAKFGLAHAADSFAPAKTFLNAFADALADRIGGVASGAPVQRRAAAARVILRHMRRDIELARLFDEPLGVIAFIGTERDAMAAGQRAEHRYRRVPFGPAGRGYHAGRRHQAVAVLHQHLPTMAELGRVCVALAIHPGLRIGARLMRLVAAFLAMKVTSGIAPDPIGVVVIAAIFTPVALLRGPGIN